MIARGTECQITGIRDNFALAWRSWLLLAAVSGALCLTPAPAAADMLVTFDLNSAKLNFDQSENELTITENIGSDILVRQEDGINVLDSAKIVAGNFEFLFTLDMANTGIDQWSATGNLAFTDTDNNINSPAVTGNFASSSIVIYPFGGGVLQIEGTLHNDSPSILQNGGNPWVFVGEETIPGEHAGDGPDNTAGQITIASPGAYDDGVVFVLKFGVNTTSLDTLFGADFEKFGGEVKGHITPEPATLGLLALGGAALLLRRKRGR